MRGFKHFILDHAPVKQVEAFHRRRMAAMWLPPGVVLRDWRLTPKGVLPGRAPGQCRESRLRARIRSRGTNEERKHLVIPS
jgi:hypothetical protein